MAKITTIQFEVPKTCGRCRFYSRVEYRVHNEWGKEARCTMGYMDKNDMRDREFSKTKFEGCGLDNPGQLIKEELGWNPWANEFDKI